MIPCALAASRWFPQRMLADTGSRDDLMSPSDLPQWLLDEAVPLRDVYLGCKQEDIPTPEDLVRQKTGIYNSVFHDEKIDLDDSNQGVMKYPCTSKHGNMTCRVTLNKQWTGTVSSQE